MYTIPGFLYHPKIYNHIKDLVSDGEKNYYDLADSQKNEIVSLIIDVLGNDSYELLIRAEDANKTVCLLNKVIQYGSKIDSDALINQLKKNARDSYAYDLNNLFDKAYEEYLNHGYNSQAIEDQIDDYLYGRIA